MIKVMRNEEDSVELVVDVMQPLHRREVCTLPIPPLVREKLLSWGFRTTADLEGLKPVQLAEEARSAKELLERQSTSRPIITFCKELDEILGGGVATGAVTEFYTEGSFTVQRAQEMASAAVAHVKKLSMKTNCSPNLVQNFTVEDVLSRIHYFRVCEYVQQLAVIQILRDFISQHPEVKLVVLDSITFHFRQGFSDMAHRTRVLSQMSQDLMEIAESEDIAVVLMNQVTTKVLDGQESRFVPALGDTWAHCASTRLFLYWQDDQRYAHVYKSSYLPDATAPYWVTPHGIRGAIAKKREGIIPATMGIGENSWSGSYL